MPWTIFRQLAGGWPPWGLGCQSAWRIGSMRAQSSSGTSQMVSKGGTGFFLRPMANTSQDFDHNTWKGHPQYRF